MSKKYDEKSAELLSFNEFFDERYKIKKNLYINVSLIGLAIAAISLGIFLVCWGM